MNQHDPQFQYIQGSFAYNVLGDVDEAKKRLRSAAEKGFADAQHLPGIIYEREKAYKSAAKYFRLAGWQGRIPASQLRLGTLYYYGRGVKRDLTEAAKWIRLGAEGGDADARYSLGILYLYGTGIEQNHFQAYAWLRAALLEPAAKVAEVVQNAEDALAQLRLTLSPKELMKAERHAAKLARKPKPKPQRAKKAKRSRKIYVGCQEVMGSVMEWSVDYAVQRTGEDWLLFVTNEDGEWDQEGPVDAAGLLELLENRGLDVGQFIEELKANSEPGLPTLAKEMERLHGTE